MDAPAPFFEIRVPVQDSDIDYQGHVSNLVFVRWVQDVAVAHWTSLAPQADQERVGWAMVRHEIDYKRAALRGDVALVRTWVGTAKRFAFNRHTQILREADGKILAASLAVWCPVSRETGRRTDVSGELRALFSVPESAASG